jgi:hypothetical protein
MTVLLHMPLAAAVDTHHDAGAERSERCVLRAAAGVVVTSEWTRRLVLSQYPIQAHRVHVARPGVDRDWHCLLAGSLDRDPDFVEQLRPPSPASATSAASGSAAS